MNEPFYQIPPETALERLQVDAGKGLSESDVRQRRMHYGPNILGKTDERPLYFLFFRQFRDLLIIVLMVATGLAFYLQDYRGGSILFAIILVNAVIGFYQEYKAERILEMLKTMVKTRVTVLREGERREVEERDLVPGDIVFLEEGNSIPADIRLVEAQNFSTNDFILTGESLPQEKQADLVLEGEVPLSSRDNLVFSGTTVARGSASGVVCATGMDTAIGDIARTSETIKRDDSPLQKEMNTLARSMTKLAGVIALVLFAMNFFLRADEFENLQLLVNASLLFAIGVAAACVPQGMPAQISVALSLGVGRMARKHAVVKRLSAVETLGSTTVICSDKTGTITSNEMTITHCYAGDHDLCVTGEGYNPEGEIRENDAPLSQQDLESLKQFFEDGFLASNGRTHPPDEQHRTWYAIGDPTEAAFTPLAIKARLDPEDLEKRFPLVREIPFDSERKRMTVIREHKGQVIGYMKGALAYVLDCCDRINRNGNIESLTEADKTEILAKGQEFSAQSLRVIALAYRDFAAGQSEFQTESTEKEFVFAGMVAMLDPPRRGVELAVQAVREAHVRLIMLTGDNPETAKAIAERIGMERELVLTGKDMMKMTDAELKKILHEGSHIFSRVSPSDKYRIVRLLKQMNEVVAVTGDGVNDTLSLKKADIGVAMGRLGSDVAKEAAEIVLLDDNFITLVTAIREGRTIFQNLKNVILSSLTSNLGELCVVCFGFVGVAFGLPIPITAVQILAIDLIGEMLPLMAMTFDPAEESVMEQPPRKQGEHIVNRYSLIDLFFFGTMMGGAAYISFYMVLLNGGSTEMSQAAAYTSIILIQFVNILSRRTTRSIISRHLFSNRHLWNAMGISLVVVLAIINIPGVAIWFGFEPMRLEDWLWPVAGALVYLLIFETRKIFSGKK
ncbi:MAG TPA: cation-transporting P-type ATPase [Gammaproteobacteria bacterium]|nr:cation-transporting P-type ATPase [Gammaproteobacteria bacterium]